MMFSHASFTVIASAALIMASAATAQSAPPTKPGLVTWVEPTAVEVHPQSDAEKQTGMISGRALPVPELLQPSLDPALPRFVTTRGLRITRAYRAGSSDVLPGLVTAWIAAFRKFHPEFRMEIAHPLAGSLGALELIKGNLDLVFVSRELKPSDISGFRDKFGYDPLSVPISGGTWRHFGFLDALGVMVNPANPVRQLSLQQLDAAFSRTHWRGGEAPKTWGDLGVTGAYASHPIHLYGIKPWNGFEEFFRQRVLSTPGHRGEWNDAAIHYDETFFAVARRVAADPDALGYTGLSAVDSEVKIVPLSVEGGLPLSPSYENVAAATYPLSRLVYLNTNARSGAALDPGLREFLRFVLSREGQTVVREQGIYLPLRGFQVATPRAQLPH
ncbi:substrate-binding domain-containing protein [Sphingomonas sp. AR_OL41]|uniref:PstS family phosphate ABC transporter substrate-binding protein n=1 Tax=Sphingomonas sp. AR_OL41 TaxID=3042729 RepID=UPI002481220E|nr:substrate-binding domain-containing protein [Sphingomonas sp. AR_OL41]MDH7974468.1 substrate-binding domain-containing protein [Sphingomonas sp. AR_OL41]